MVHAMLACVSGSNRLPPAHDQKGVRSQVHEEVRLMRWQQVILPVKANVSRDPHV